MNAVNHNWNFYSELWIFYNINWKILRAVPLGGNSFLFLNPFNCQYVLIFWYFYVFIICELIKFNFIFFLNELGYCGYWSASRFSFHSLMVHATLLWCSLKTQLLSQPSKYSCTSSNGFGSQFAPVL